jgi:hypothetical protein
MRHAPLVAGFVSAPRIAIAMIVALLLLACGEAERVHRPWITDLKDDLDSGAVEVVTVSGNGSSSGAALNGIIANATDSNVRINTVLRRPLFFMNRGSAQNMVAVAVYGTDGSYSRDSRGAYVQLPPNARQQVLFIAFCVDFDKANPSAMDRFAVADIPASLEPIVAQMVEYLSNMPDGDLTIAGQTALWMWQGVSLSEIRARFHVDDSDAAVARRLIAQAGL